MSREASGRLAGPRPPSRLLGLAVAALVVAAVTLIIYPLRGLEPSISTGVLYVLGVLLVSTYWGFWLGLVTSAASVLALAYFHAPPTGTFALSNSADRAGIVVLFITAVVASFIADRARLRAVDAEERLRLEEELRRREGERIRLQEVSASRARVLEAADEERRRVVRDIHDGAQQRMVNSIITLKLARRALQDGKAVEGLMDEALDHAEQGTAALRELSHGILPSVLTRGGLRAGVNALASRAPLPVTADVSAERLPAAIEATAYFIVSEALTNVVKHAQATGVDVRASVADGVLHVAVRDDGIGGARADGSGLTGLEDRVSALNGELQVTSPPSGGTLVAADLPLPS